ncbi:hypothetical protein D7D52_12020 [Nocardia yunnanensis]|uniref:Uncharacterized protein n=1 Tax=Nocardia yunnanensis TaxID=2382165 RepID=A0A386ZB23_9NOCA|nr:hypothetical protein [Nocardia yunnanensis]AYF74467.1 hypothetical protein D7D52_12020 [Nocardia yunnanensis]
MSSQTAVADEVVLPPLVAENGVPAGIEMPAKVRETQFAALAAMGLAMLHGLISAVGGADRVLGSVGHFFGAWLIGGVALLFGLRSRWVWVGALGVASLQAFLGAFTLVSAEMPTGVGPFTVLFGVMVSGVVLALLLRKDCYTWFTPA